MPIRIDNDLPAKAALEEENVFVMDKERACTQDQAFKDCNFKSDAKQIRHGTSFAEKFIKYTITVRYHIFTDRILCSDSCIRVTYGEIL